MEELDPLSNLPDEVRSHILSFLTTKEAASTSILSKRWRNLFALVPNLNVDDSVFLHPEEGKRERPGILQSFMDFVDRVLDLQGDSPIKKFSLKCSTGVCPYRVNIWICTVLQRGVSELDLSISLGDDDDCYYLPREMFVSNTLVNLKLTSEFSLCWWAGAENTFLPMLKRLYIEAEMFFCDDKIEMLLPCFPVLEELYMADLPWKDFDETVSSATLAKLKICAVGSERFQNPKSISFDTPSLRYLGYSDLVAEDYPLVNMKNLLEARILFLLTEDQVKEVRAPDNGDAVLKFGNVVKLLIGIQSVEALHLHSDSLEVLSVCRESMPVFNNVKTLGIRSDERRGWQAMPLLLRNCPHLEFLCIEGLVHHVTDGCGDACDCNYRKDKGRSLKSCPVKFIEIQGFRGTMKEMRMIEHFLDYFPCLEEMRIYIEENGTTPLRNDLEVSELVVEMIEDYKDMYNCKVRLLMSDNLLKKWTTQPGL